MNIAIKSYNLEKLNMSKDINTNRGFTLIELLIVIAIIGVLAATVVVSLGDQTAAAKRGSAKASVASVASLARIEVDTKDKDFDNASNALCDALLPNVTGEKKASWEWQPGTQCEANDADGVPQGEICCSSDNNVWVVWSNISGDGADDGEVYCADSTTFRGEININSTESGSVTSVKDGDATVSPKTCQ